MDNGQLWKDVDPKYRPGVPMEHKPYPAKGADAEDTHTRQPPSVPILMHRLRKKLPPVFGTAAPLKGLSGVMRVLAYKYPDHWARRWMILLLADRVDVAESTLLSALRWRPGRFARSADLQP